MTEFNTKIERTSLSDEVYSRLKQLILIGHWKPGEKLPSEQTLANMFSVSRLTMRIAIEKLNALRILETKVGDGTYVQPFDFKSYISDIDELLLDTKIINDVGVYRNILEMGAIQVIVCSENFDCLAPLWEICASMEEMIIDFSSGEPEQERIISEYAKLDYNFHCNLCIGCGNQLIYYAYLMAKSPIQKYMSLILRKRLDEYRRDHPDVRTIQIEELYSGLLDRTLHRSILEAINKKDLATCTLIHDHFHSYGLDSLDFSQ